MKFLFSICLSLLFISMHSQTKYPKTNEKNVADTFFGTEVQDPYRWLEDDLSKETEEWVKEQNAVTFDYLNNIPFRDNIKKEVQDIYNYEKFSAPFKRGEYTYFYKNDGLQQHYVLYRQKDENSEPEVFLDPNTFSEDGSVSLAGISFSHDGKFAAYQISEGGSDWRKVIVINTENKHPIGEPLKDVKFSDISWYKETGFFYSSYDKPKDKSELSGKTQYHKLYYHVVGTPQENDKLIFGGSENPHRYIGGEVSEDQKYLFISAANNTSGNKLFMINLRKDWSKPIPIVEHENTDTNYFDNDGDTVYLLTNLGAPNNRLISFLEDRPQVENWLDIIPENKLVLNVTKSGKYFFAHYIEDVKDQVFQFHRDGRVVRMIDLPGIGSVSGFSGRYLDKEVYYTFTNQITPGNIYKYNVETGKGELYKKSSINFNPDEYETEQIFYASKDGTTIPMTVSYHKDMVKNGKNPTILYGYGGFNISLMPSFNIFAAQWMKMGGVYAVANLRGGGEYGKDWHDAGTQMKKKNVFNDFIAAAETLILRKFTSPEKLAIRGGSNGGLLVGATMTMRPDLFKVALPAVGVLDMLRYHTFTAGAGWAYDYGTAEDSKEMFDYLYSYSPVHNVKKSCYPATLVTTGDHDDRVVPAHSYKFVAELQKNQQCDNPTLIRIETQAGHGAGKSTEVIINEYADIMSFTLFNMGVNPFAKK